VRERAKAKATTAAMQQQQQHFLMTITTTPIKQNKLNETKHTLRSTASDILPQFYFLFVRN